MIRSSTFLLMLIALTGCAHVQMQAPKDPIKLDISMRLDVYQHIEKDIDAIENMVTEPQPKKSSPASWVPDLVQDAYADELTEESLQNLIAKRKARRPQIMEYQQAGILGENLKGLLTVRKPDAQAKTLADAENADRQAIYETIAQKNGSMIADVEKLYNRRLKDDAPSGTPLETINAQGQSEWIIKP